MRYQRIIPGLLAFLIMASAAQAKTRDWQTVLSITPGARISVKAKHRVGCIFQRATQDELVCSRIHRDPFGIALLEIVFDRASIREVRLERSDDANAAVGAAIGVGAGVAAGASIRGNGTRAGGAVLLGAIGGISGWSFGREFHILRDQIVYSR